MTVRASFLRGGENDFQTSADDVARLLTWIKGEGIPENAAATSLAVRAQGSPNKTVKVVAGKILMKATPTDEAERLFSVEFSADHNVTIADNTTGSTRYDKVYIQLDADDLHNPPSDGDLDEDTVLKTKRFTTANQSLGESNAIELAEITVANNFTEITNANISDKRKFLNNGWSDVTTLTRTADTTATLVGDWTGILAVGDKFRWLSDGTLRQNYLVAVSYASGTGLTTVTITSGYVTTANDSRFESGQTITVPQFSKASSPVGFPHWFAYTPTITMSAGSRGSETDAYKFCVIGRLLKITFLSSWTQQLANANSLRFTNPFAISTTARKQLSGTGAVGGADFGLYGSSDATLTYVYKYDSGDAFTPGSNCLINGGVDYEI